MSERRDFILNIIKPATCNVVFLDDVSKLAPVGSCYRPETKTVYIVPWEKSNKEAADFARDNFTDYEKSISVERSLLHEIGHHVTFPEEHQYIHVYSVDSTAKSPLILSSPDLQHSEYLAERWFIDKCKEYDWHDLLEMCYKSIKEILKSPLPIPGDAHGYGYMAYRLAREEKL